MPQNRRQIFVPGTLSEKQSDNILLFTAYVTFFHVFQPTNNFRFMNTKPSAQNDYRGIYETPYDAFTNYMNILGDFITRVNNLYPDIDNEELSSLLTSIKNQEEEIEMKDKEIVKLRAIITKLTRESEKSKKPTKKTTKEKTVKVKEAN